MDISVGFGPLSAGHTENPWIYKEIESGHTLPTLVTRLGSALAQGCLAAPRLGTTYEPLVTVSRICGQHMSRSPLAARGAVAYASHYRTDPGH